MRLGLALLQVVLGVLFVGHGAQKLWGKFGGHGPAGTGMFFESLGLKPGKPMALAAGASEAGGGALLTLGLATPLGSMLISSTMITAPLKAHRQQGVWLTGGGYEYNLLILAAAFVLADLGPGAMSLDEALGIETKGPAWALGQLALAAAGAAAVMQIGSSEAVGGEPDAPLEGKAPAGDPATA